MPTRVNSQLFMDNWVGDDRPLQDKAPFFGAKTSILYEKIPYFILSKSGP